LFEKDVGGFDVAVDNFMLLEFLVALNDVFHEEEGLGLAEPRSFFRIKIGLKVTVLAIFEKQVEILSTLEVII
jgi:hypothetical protein